MPVAGEAAYRAGAVPRDPTGAGPWLPLCAALVCLAVGAYLGRSLLAFAAVSDAFIPIYVSLTHWQPFCIGMARYGMLVPLLAIPFRDPVTNYLVENFLNASLGVGVFFLLAACLETGIAGFAAGAWALAYYVGFDDRTYQFFYLSTVSHWGPGLAIGLGAFLAWRDPRRWARPMGSVLLVLSVWVDATALIFVIPLVLAIWVSRALPSGRLRELWRAQAWEELVLDRDLEFLLLGTTLFAVSMLLAPLARTSDAARFMTLAPTAEWRQGWHRLTSNFLRSVPDPVPVVTSSAIGIAVAIGSRNRQAFARTVPVTTALAASILIQFVGLGISGWVKTAEYGPSYLFPARVATFTLPALVGVSVVAGYRSRRYMPILAVAGVLATGVALVSRYKIGSPSAIRAALEHQPRMTTYGRAVARESCTHWVAADERAWPTGFYAAVLRYPKHRPPPTVITPRLPRSELRWHAAVGQSAVICAPADDPGNTLGTLARFAEWPTLELVKRSDTINIWRPRRQPSW